jgi:ATP-dependent metalloprotease
MAWQDPHSPLLRSDEAFQIYLLSLEKINMPKSIDFAVRRRDTLLAAAAAVAPSSATTVAPGSKSTTEATPSSPSQEIAQAVLAGNPAATTTPPPPTISPELQRLAEVLAKGSGSSANPIFVTVSERGYPILYSLQYANSHLYREAKGAWVVALSKYAIVVVACIFCEFLV